MVAFAELSTISVLPKRLEITGSYSLLYLTSSSASPNAPTSLSALCASKHAGLGLTDVIGKKVNLPKSVALKYSIKYLASSGVPVTTFCAAAARAVSRATSYFLSLEISSATTPLIRLLSSVFVFALVKSCFTTGI